MYIERKGPDPKPTKEEKPKKYIKIRPRSKKESKKDRLYSVMIKQFLKDNPRCKVFPFLPSEEVHHTKGRGKYYLDVTTWIAVSRRAHRLIEANPLWAYLNGYSQSRLAK